VKLDSTAIGNTLDLVYDTAVDGVPGVPGTLGSARVSCFWIVGGTQSTVAVTSRLPKLRSLALLARVWRLTGRTFE
jgi:hypothetical protein